MIDERKIGIVLGAGVGRGWAHIGVLDRLAELHIRPDIVCGCSIGALVGASYVTGHLERLTELATSLTWRRVLGYMDVSFAGGGLIEGRWIVRFFEENVEDTAIERAAPVYGAVATELHTGREAWLTQGSIIDAVRASIALPGLMTPINIRGKWLVDGGLVNPLPVSLCRALGADVILGVSLNGDLVSRPLSLPQVVPEQTETEKRSEWLRWLSYGLPGGLVAESGPPEPKLASENGERPGYIEVLGESFFITQDFVSRVRLAADPVDVLVTPDVADIGVIEFHRADEAIAAGRAAVDAVAPAIAAAIGRQSISNEI